MIPDSLSLFHTIIEMLIPVAVGVILTKTGVLNDDFAKKLSVFVLYVAHPFLLVTSINAIPYSGEMIRSGALVMLAALLTHLIAIGVSTAATAPVRDRPSAYVTTCCMSFSNCGFFGFPLLKAAYGDVGVFWGSFFVVVFNLLNWSYGVFILSRANPALKLKPIKIFFNAGTIPCFIGLLIYLLRIPLYGPLTAGMERIAAVCSPVSMVIIGIMIARLPLRKLLFSFLPYYTVLMKQLVIPLLTGVLLRLVGIPFDFSVFCALMIALPAATTTAMFAENYDIRPELAAQNVGMTTVLSLFTVPLVMRLLDGLMTLIFRTV